MPSCEQMKKGQIYECTECGLQLQVVQECTTCATTTECGCPCTFVCCEKELTLKQ
jgi:predicted nucleic acid-binding Zn ribbon protein